MTLDEIMQRRGLVDNDIAHIYPHGKYKGEPVVCEYKETDGDYAFVLDVIEDHEWRYVLQPHGFDIVGYYPTPGDGVYLVKRKAVLPDTVQVTVTMDYELIADSDGNVTDSKWRNFKLEVE